MINLYDHQKEAIEKLQTGSILCGGVGSGKSITSIAYFFTKECGGVLPKDKKPPKLKTPKDLYIITTAKKRDLLEWEGECSPFCLSKDRESSIANIKVTIDSWNNIAKYKDVKKAFFIFDEQRLVGSGKWVKSFLNISKYNNWILLSATPGDTWTDYIPVFIANGFYKNRTEFLNRHAVYSRFSKFPKIEKFIETKRLEYYRQELLVDMKFKRNTISHNIIINVEYDKPEFKKVMVERWNIFKNEPIMTAGQLCYVMRRVVNTHPSRLKAIIDIFNKHSRLIIFYNFDYELEILRTLGETLKVTVAEWNGHKHQTIPIDNKWIYLVQYTAGAEGWNCITTNAIVFYSLNYSYKTVIQASGRIDRINTKYRDLYYYHLMSKSAIDLAINRALKNKKDFNERKYFKF